RCGARGRRVSGPVLLRGRSALRWRRWPRGPVQTTGLVPVIGLVGPVAMLGLVRPVAMLRLVGPVTMLGLVRPVAMLGLVRPVAMLGLVRPVGPTAAAVSLIFGAGATPRWLNLGRRDDARATEVTTAHAHVAPAIVVHGPLAHPRHEGVRRRRSLKMNRGSGL